MKKLLFTLIALTIYCGLCLPINVAAQYTKSDLENSKNSENFDLLIEKAKKNKYVSVIVGLNFETKLEGYMNENEKINQRNSIKNIQDNLISQLSRFNTKLYAQYKYIPFLALKANAKALKFLKESNNVVSIRKDKPNKLMLEQSRNIVGMQNVETMGYMGAGYTGTGQVIAVLDSGIKKDHPFLDGKVVSEACYSHLTGLDSDGIYFLRNTCGGFLERTNVGSGVPCSGDTDGSCTHGTHVAGIAAGLGNHSGIAKNAELISIKVVTIREDNRGGKATWGFDSDILKGLDRVLHLKTVENFNISSINISLGGEDNSSGDCSNSNSDNEAYEMSINQLKSYSIATVVATGNDNFVNAISSPACVESAISVGATEDGSLGTSQDQIWSDSAGGTNSSPSLDLLAPGAWIYSSVNGSNIFQNKRGTSMAAPHVAGAWAVIKEKYPNATVDQIENALKVTGKPITDMRAGANNRIKPRINIDKALIYLSNTKFDFDGDAMTDISILRPNVSPTKSEWWYLKSSDNASASVSFGLATDTPVPADFTGDGITDVAYLREDANNPIEWFILRSEDATFYSLPFGSSGDIPVPGDFDGDGIDDTAVYRPNTGTWYIIRSSDSQTDIIGFGNSTDKPVVADYDGDGKDDVAIYRPSVAEWWIDRSQDGLVVVQFGQTGDKTVQGDYTGDGKDDVAFYRPNTGEWFVIRSEDNTFYSFPFGISTDDPTPGDYDGDGKNDAAVFRPSENNWYINGTTSGVQIIGFGAAGDVPLPNVYSVQ